MSFLSKLVEETEESVDPPSVTGGEDDEVEGSEGEDAEEGEGVPMEEVAQSKYSIVVIQPDEDVCRGVKRTKDAFCLKRAGVCHTVTHKHTKLPPVQENMIFVPVSYTHLTLPTICSV